MPIQFVELWYPDMNNSDAAVDVALMHVRAARDIRISYDFERDGWVIRAQDEEIEDAPWVEKAFIPAWEHP